MQIVFHIGAHCTDDGQILRCLNKNRALWATQGIAVPNPGNFRPIVRETLAATGGQPANSATQDLLLRSIIETDNPSRVILSNEAFLCNPHRVLTEDQLYAEAGEKVAKLRNLFPNCDVEFCMSIRNPATFLPACFERLQTESFEAYMALTDPRTLLWSEVVGRIHAYLPGVPLKIWSNEDTPFIWRELIQSIADHDNSVELQGIDDFIATIMTAEGIERMRVYLQSHPPANESQRRRILSAFLDKFEIAGEVEIELDCPGWSAEFVDELTNIYEDDLYTIERMPGVDFISP